MKRDLLIAAIATAVVQVDLWFIEEHRDQHAVTIASALMFTAPLAWRRSNPMLMIGLSSLAMAAGALLGGDLTETLTAAFAGMVVVFSAAAYLSRRDAYIAATMFTAASWIDAVFAIQPDESLVSDAAFILMIVVAGPFLAGRALRDRRARTEELERLNERLKQEQTLREQMAVLDERSRIAREMHDVVAHSVSLMVVQTGAARSLLDEDLEQSRSALLAVEDAGREALAELRRALGVMRGSEGDETGLTPQPGVGQIGKLIDRARDAGLPVTLEVTGDPRPLPGGADLAAYRIVQEALTNSIRHAGPATATVALDWQPRSLTVEVTDTGRGPNGHVSPDSHGLVGMRERVAVYGGTVQAGAGANGGFTVRATIPLETAS